TATDTRGRQGSAQWTFLASGPANGGDLRITPLAPSPGRILDSGTNVRIAARLETSATLRTPTLLLDGRPLALTGGGAGTQRDTIFTEVTGVVTGTHSVQVQVSDDAGHTQAVVWTF